MNTLRILVTEAAILFNRDCRSASLSSRLSFVPTDGQDKPSSSTALEFVDVTEKVGDAERN